MSDLVLVKWVDSSCDSAWRKTVLALESAVADTLKCETVGWLIAETDTYILVAASRTTDRGDDPEQVADTMQIPRGAVTAIHALATYIGRKPKEATVGT